MKDKKHKYLEDLIEEYIQLTEEQAEIPTLINKVISDYQEYSKQHKGTVISADEAQFAFKIYNQIGRASCRERV